MSFIEVYNECEKSAIANSTFIERKIFSPVTHVSENDPTRIASISELPYFVCTMQDGRAEDTTNYLLNGLTEEEFRLVGDILKKVLDISSTWGLKTAPHSSLLRHLYQRRLIRHLLPNAQNFLEIGPGSGYLSLMLALDGKGIANTDVTQAYYIFQHYLYDSFGCLREIASLEKAPLNVKGKSQLLPGKVVHIPWWVYKDMTANSLKVDVIIVNHAICEMHGLAVQHLLAVAQRLGFPHFFMESTGLLPTFDRVKLQFLSYGYSLKYSKNDVYVFEHEKNIYNRAANTSLKVINRVKKLIPFGCVFKNESSRISSELRILYRHLVRRKSSGYSIFKPYHIRYNDVLKLYEEILGMSDFKSLNEEFFDSIKYKEYKI